MRPSTVMVLLVAVCLALSAAAVPLRQRKSHLQRVRRKVGQLNVSSTSVQYMEDLLLKIADEEGKPRNLVQDPLTVWCFMDEDIVGGTVREKLRTDTKCTSVIRYVFQWESLTSFRNHLPVERGILRVYMQVISRLITNDEVATVTVAVSVNTFSNKSNITSEVHLEESVITDKQEINVTGDSNGWQEINITNALRSIWPPNEDTSIVEIVLRLEVDCKERKKIPVNFFNPAEISLERVNRRERYEALQPLMLVFLDDNEIKEKIKKEEEAGHVVEQESDVTLQEGERRRRTTYTHICRMENFTINFGELGLNHVLSPHSVNIRRCSGSCSHNAIKLNGHIATNHAKMMASTYRLHQLNLISSQAPREPCCVPVKYRYMFLLTQHRNLATQLRPYPDFVVEGCGCR